MKKPPTTKIKGCIHGAVEAPRSDMNELEDSQTRAMFTKFCNTNTETTDNKMTTMLMKYGNKK
jgi:hypothetical protein